MQKLPLTLVLSASLVVAISACSTTPVTPKNVLRDAVLNSHVAVTPIAKPAELSERTKAQAVGNFVVASVVSSAVGSSAGAVNAQQMQANMQIMQSFNQNLQQALPDSYVVAAGKGADLALAKKLSNYLTTKAQPSTPNNRELSIAVNTPLWELGYVSFLTSQDYALNYHLQVSVLEQKEGKLHALKTVSCANSAKNKMPLEQWKAENYKAVDINAEVIVNECFNRFLAETGLN
ncbi:hypothetical protein [Methylotenera sp. L2L1]|uniref:hypothetical protein n=1 Tax=Methylotenera sp. L2L1 TaxID=1502770 RepID=UPI00055C9687|nr:hypothetical protein [Methylotenera sp. L2L1]